MGSRIPSLKVYIDLSLEVITLFLRCLGEVFCLVNEAPWSCYYRVRLAYFWSSKSFLAFVILVSSIFGAYSLNL